MIKPIISLKERIDLYRIIPISLDCPDCNKHFNLDTPMAIPGYRGIIMSDHGCGPNMPFRIVPVDPDKIAFWEALRPSDQKGLQK